MGKNHAPGDFARNCGYRSDLETAETGPMVKSVNTSFGSNNHNAYIHRTDGTHEHFYYSPKTAKSGWHGHNYETRNNHPKGDLKANSDMKGKPMEKNSFIESITVDKSIVERCNEVSRNADKNSQAAVSNKNHCDSGRERGDTGPASLGRESGLKCGNSDAHASPTGESQGHSGQTSSGHGQFPGKGQGGH